MPGLDARSIELLKSAASLHGIVRLQVFGSVARGEDGPESDLDLLVAVEHGRSLLDVIGFCQEAEAALGRKIDVVTEGGLSPYLRQRILAEAVPL